MVAPFLYSTIKMEMKRKIIIVLLAFVCTIVLTSCSFMEGLVQVADALSATTTSSSYTDDTSSSNGYIMSVSNTRNTSSSLGHTSRSSNVSISQHCKTCGGSGTCSVGVSRKHSCHGSGKCDFCGGKGTSYINGIPYECPNCNGKGKCHFCNGTGKCKRCNGTGRA